MSGARQNYRFIHSLSCSTLYKSALSDKTNLQNDFWTEICLDDSWAIRFRATFMVLWVRKSHPPNVHICILNNMWAYKCVPKHNIVCQKSPNDLLFLLDYRSVDLCTLMANIVHNPLRFRGGFGSEQKTWRMCTING